MLLRFCPSCGGKLPQISAIKYCSFCGENLASLTAAGSVAGPAPAGGDEPGAGKADAFADAAHRYDEFIADLRQKGLDEAEIRRQAAEMFAKLKEHMPAPSAKRKFVPQVPARPDLSDGHFTVVLKSCHDKERLTRRLSEVLRRGLAATRLAVEMVPGIIIYKSPQQDIQPALAIFEDEQLHYSVLKGDFSADTPVEKVIPGFAGLDSGLQVMLRNTPGTLWLGERPCLVVPEVETEDWPGMLVATDRGLYIFNRSFTGRRPEWRIIPYSQLAEVIFHGGQDGELELRYKEIGREEWLQIADTQQLEQVYEHILHSLEQER